MEIDSANLSMPRRVWPLNWHFFTTNANKLECAKLFSAISTEPTFPFPLEPNEFSPSATAHRYTCPATDLLDLMGIGLMRMELDSCNALNWRTAAAKCPPANNNNDT